MCGIHLKTLLVSHLLFIVGVTSQIQLTIQNRAGVFELVKFNFTGYPARISEDQCVTCNNGQARPFFGFFFSPFPDRFCALTYDSGCARHSLEVDIYAGSIFLQLDIELSRNKKILEFQPICQSGGFPTVNRVHMIEPLFSTQRAAGGIYIQKGDDWTGTLNCLPESQLRSPAITPSATQEPAESQTIEAASPSGRTDLYALLTLMIPALLIPAVIIYIRRTRQRKFCGIHCPVLTPDKRVASPQTPNDYMPMNLELSKLEGNSKSQLRSPAITPPATQEPAESQPIGAASPSVDGQTPAEGGSMNASVDDRGLYEDVYITPTPSNLGDVSGDKAHVITNEFTFLKVKQPGETIIGDLPVNRPMNRNKKILPCDKSRISLSPVNSSGSDYINATRYDALSSQNAYIAAMGPMKTTAEDFWQMVWQEGVSVIAMLTKLNEGKKEKCFQYWPDPSEDCGKMFKDISVKCEREEILPYFQMRSFTLNKNQQQRQVTQLHILRWDDMETPTSEKGFLAFYEKVDSIHEQHKCSPLLVQSSCGAGRAGTFIAIHDLLAYAQKDDRVNVFDCVSRLREHRPDMVQTEAQYRFIYQILKLRKIKIIQNKLV